MIPRPEHPKPQFRRDTWENLNGEWDFVRDTSPSANAAALFRDDAVYDRKITVPFCMQSRLSGIGETDFAAVVWYRRRFTVPASESGKNVYLHFGACDYLTTVYINGTEVGKHAGGYVSFSFDITKYVHPGENTVVVMAEDNELDPLIPTGKQSDRPHSYSCFYTRTTGIWQTVWLEYVPKTHIKSVRYSTDINAGTLTVEAILDGKGTFSAKASFDGRDMGCASLTSDGGNAVLTLCLTEKHLWELGKGGLYDLVLTYGDDCVYSYFGLRDIRYGDMKFYLNGKSVFQRLVLDQGFNPDGIYTAPSDEELCADITRSMAMGFNGARLHEKIFEERFLYHADRLGYMVWGEYPNWGIDYSDPRAVFAVLPEWLEEVERDRNHPSLVGWCPFNETWDYRGRHQCDDLLRMIYLATKAADPTRPCIDTSGNFHVITDIYDIHDYTGDPEEFRRHFESLEKDGTYHGQFDALQPYTPGDLFFVSEYGGIRWTDKADGWGYGDAPKTTEEFLARLKGVTDVLLDHPKIFAFCYTQLTDVEQEQNGLYTYDRRAKFPPEIIAPIFSRKAAVED